MVCAPWVCNQLHSLPKDFVDILKAFDSFDHVRVVLYKQNFMLPYFNTEALLNVWLVSFKFLFLFPYFIDVDFELAEKKNTSHFCICSTGVCRRCSSQICHQIFLRTSPLHNFCKFAIIIYYKTYYERLIVFILLFGEVCDLYINIFNFLHNLLYNPNFTERFSLFIQRSFQKPIEIRAW